MITRQTARQLHEGLENRLQLLTRNSRTFVINVDRQAEGAPGDTFIYGRSVAAATALGAWVCEQTHGSGNAVMMVSSP